ncbi:shikimate 5-dehydrogenase [Rhodococcus sp. HNM0569]|uniref:shikimate 5-dehydrogenase n=1 Tax=Rhodococcus sp. HNM0569 TaxID=2716340 RepID=UPI00146EDE4A|nr:shikimate 5-dehydrogenase [Rhodococcus sp. HNM0569]NLU84428.1 shikimate 5-dehydrogenase [Rhodococcus sp. HNM0569]
MNVLNRDTRLCISLSGRPSNIGTRFHNYLYAALGMNFVYKAMTTDDIAGAVTGIRALGIRGCGVSMPFKEDVLGLVDVVHDSAAAIDSVNTIVNDDGVLHAYNTDYQAVARLLAEHSVSGNHTAAVAGSGGMAKAVVAAVRAAGVTECVVAARNERTGRALAERYGFTWAPDLADRSPDVLINATPIGMAGGPDADTLAFTREAVDRASLVFDVVASPPDTPLVRAATDAGTPVVTGAQVIALQAAEQFVLYTGVRPADDLIAAASVYSRE